jgi:hypothetical protein
MGRVSFEAASSELEDETPAIAVKISGGDYELNVWLRMPELPLLAKVPTTTWDDGALRAGQSASAAAFWSCDDGQVSVFVGHDDETWDFSVSFPAADFQDMLDEIERERREGPE